eukprot:TRINITY_DN65989_c4_g5_i1.p3 TRINITY_DN65989_c4_g5~~TRINITY_DN65989_c4_g5_i1.p3  ORF type:complete len:250 (+),score=147.57 TRINITY_DN65989_c4_g5_i1:188-937(+)
MDVTPYSHIDVVFNDRRLYANLQGPNPEKINYNFNDPQRWGKFTKRNWHEFVRTRVLNSFYPDKTLISVQASELEVAKIQEEIEGRIVGSIVSHREYECHAETDVYEEFAFPSGTQEAKPYLMERLEMEERVGRNPDLIEIDWNNAHHDEKDEKFDPDALQLAREDWTKEIKKSLDKNSLYVERLYHFKHSDGNRISDSILRRCKKLLEIPAELMPTYAVACKIERLPAMLSPCRVLICVTYDSGKQDN